MEDIQKMKVADLKKELKMRSLSTAGKRTELLERLQNAIASGVNADAGDDDEEFDEDEILAGDDDEDEISQAEEEQALAGKAAPTPSRPTRRSSLAPSTPAGTPKTPGRRLALKRAPAAALAVPEEEEPAKEEVAAPKVAVKTTTPAKTPAKSPAKTPASAPAEGQPPAKAAKVETKAGDPAEDKENGEPKEMSALEKRAARFGVVAPDVAKAKRAERFGVVSEDLAKKKRAERFGVVEEEKANKTLKKGKMAAEPVDLEAIKKRAERFGTSTAPAMDLEKKAARAERFGTAANGAKTDVTSDEVLAKRAAKFGTGEEAEKTEAAAASPVVSATGKKLITFGSEDTAKLKRAARFAAAN